MSFVSGILEMSARTESSGIARTPRRHPDETRIRSSDDRRLDELWSHCRAEHKDDAEARHSIGKRSNHSRSVRGNTGENEQDAQEGQEAQGHPDYLNESPELVGSPVAFFASPHLTPTWELDKGLAPFFCLTIPAIQAPQIQSRCRYERASKRSRIECNVSPVRESAMNPMIQSGTVSTRNTTALKPAAVALSTPNNESPTTVKN